MDVIVVISAIVVKLKEKYYIMAFNFDISSNYLNQKHKNVPYRDSDLSRCRDQDSNLGYFGHNEGY